MLCSRLVDGRLLVKIRSGWGRGGVRVPIKRVMGRREQATKPAPSPGAAARTPGGRSPAPARTRTGPTRDAAARSPQRRLIMTGPGRARAVTGTAGPTSARWSHARNSPLFPVACLAAPRLTLAAQYCGGYMGYFRGVVLPEREHPLGRNTEENPQVRCLSPGFPHSPVRPAVFPSF